LIRHNGQVVGFCNPGGKEEFEIAINELKRPVQNSPHEFNFQTAVT